MERKGIINIVVFLFLVLFGVMIVSLMSSVSYAKVRYHSLGDDASRIYVKGMKLVNLDYKNYKWQYMDEVGRQYYIGKPKRSGNDCLVLDAVDLNLISRTKWGNVRFSSDGRYMIDVSGDNAIVKDLKANKTYKYRIPNIVKRMMKYKGGAPKKYFIINERELIGFKEGKDWYDYIVKGDMLSDKVRKICKLGEDIDYFEYFDENNIFYKSVYVGEENRDDTAMLYRIKTVNCIRKKLYEVKGYVSISILESDLEFDYESFMKKSYYLNNRGKIRIALSLGTNYERFLDTIMDRDGRIIKRANDNLLYKKFGKIAKDLSYVRYSEGYISFDDNLVVIKVGKGNPTHADLWVKEGKKHLLIYDFKNNVKELRLDYLSDTIYDEIYWHPLGDRLIIRKDKTDKYFEVILGRRK